MVLPVTVAHAHQIQSDFADAGIDSEVIHANTEIEEREAIFDRIRNDTLKIVISCGCLTEGFSIKKISCLINARPTKSKATWIQGAGRVLRFMEGKHAIIFDHGGTALTLGLPEDIEIDELCTGKKSEGKSEEQQKKEYDALPKPCKRCGVLREPGKAVCHKCGYKTVRKEDVEVARELGLKILKGESKKEPTKDDKQKFYSELLGWQLSQEMHGKTVSKGRVAHIYKDKFGVFPRGLDEKISSPSQELTGFIQSRIIAFAKARQQQQGN
jgi:DNA repair protein RadD